MAANFQVRSRVIDLSKHLPQRNETFLVDTNVWFWTVYPRLTDCPDIPSYQIRDYPEIMARIVKAGGKPHWCGLTFSELAHCIEETEYRIWSHLPGQSARSVANSKEFRHNFTSERASVLQTIDTVWQGVTSVASILRAPVMIDQAATDLAKEELCRYPLDGYDLFLLQTARNSGVTNIISDDGDLCTVPDITLFTCNRNVISQASLQGKLVA